MTFTVDDASQIAYVWHDGQLDKGGKPYIQHPERVALSVFQAGGTEEQEMAAWLHDIIEDTDVTGEMLIAWSVPWDVLQMVHALTHQPNERNSIYYERIRGVPDAVLVKLCDIWDNLDPTRMCYFDDATQQRLRNKYGQALIALSA